MKKGILFIILSLVLVSFLNSQVKVTFKLTNPGFDTLNIFKFDLQAIVPAGQVWRVGSSNIRVDFYTIPTGKLTVRADNSTNGGVRGALPLLNHNAAYGWMTTTALTASTISLNIVWNSASDTVFHMTPGTYTLGRLRFTKTDTTTGWCTHDTIRCSTVQGQSSVVQDSLTALSYPGQWTRINPTDSCTLVGVVGIITEIPTEYRLYNNYPNPFNPTTTIKYDVPKNGLVKLVIFDVLGKEVVTLVNEKKMPGSYETVWNASNFASGTYFLKMETDTYTNIKKIVLVK